MKTTEITTRFTITVACSEELLVLLTREQAEQLLDEPETELVVYYPEGHKVIVRIDTTKPNENRTMH